MDIRNLVRISDSAEDKNEVKWEDIKLHGKYTEKIEGNDDETLPVKLLQKMTRLLLFMI